MYNTFCKWVRDSRGLPSAGPLKLPTIFPIIYYNGEAAYYGPLTLAELFEDPETFTKMINGPMKVIDTGAMDTARFKAEATAYVFHSLMKNIHSPKLKRILLDLQPYMMQIEMSGDVDFIVRSFKYLIDSARTSQEDLIEVIQNLSSSRGEVMTIMETWTSQIHEYKTIIAGYERKQAIIEREKAVAEREKAEAEREKAEAEREKAEAEREKAEAERNAIRNLLGQGMEEAIIAKCLDVPASLVQNIKAELV